MKVQFILIGYVNGETMPYVFGRNGNFISYNLPENLKLAKRWATREGVERFIVSEQKAGADWGYLILPVEPAGASQAASSLGQLGAGKAKTISPEESEARRLRLAIVRAKRWMKN